MDDVGGRGGDGLDDGDHAVVVATSHAGLLNGLHATGWNLPADLDLDRWRLAGRMLGGVGLSVPWALGDWLNRGERQFGEAYTQYADETGYEKQSLMIFKYVASRIEPERRRPELSWSHHSEVASLPAPEQEVWLDRAQAEEWSSKQLREERRKAKTLGTTTEEPQATREDLMRTADDLRTRLAAAEHDRERLENELGSTEIRRSNAACAYIEAANERDQLRERVVAADRVIAAYRVCDSNRGAFSCVQPHDLRCPAGIFSEQCVCGRTELDAALEAYESAYGERAA